MNSKKTQHWWNSSLALPIEVAAVVCSLAFTLLYLRGAVPLAWWPALLGSVLFAGLCFQRRIYAECALHLFYVAMAIYGLVHSSTNPQAGGWQLWQHTCSLIGAALLTALAARLLIRHTNAQLPWLDAFTTVFSLLATWQMANFVHTAWLYWIVIDSAAVALYAARRLYLGAALFVLYTAMAVDGYFPQIQWFG